ncbi:MAG TPA: HAD family hydrolase, partial [Bacteroidetes bacterium]|nr:HAD family hydrolase [Bacteroidota bacterium]
MSNKAIIWDYDGTLVDTRVKNFEVTKRLMHRLLGARSGEFPALRRLDQYVQATRTAENWRALYRNEFGMTEGEIDEAGR